MGCKIKSNLLNINEHKDGGNTIIDVSSRLSDAMSRSIAGGRLYNGNDCADETTQHIIKGYRSNELNFGMHHRERENRIELIKTCSQALSIN